MKKLKLSILVSLAAIVILFNACATWDQAAGKTLVTTAQSVDAAMKGWAMYVVMSNPPTNQQAEIKAAYIRYQASFDAALKAYNVTVVTKDQGPWQAASAALLSAQTSLLSIITAFNTPK